MKIINKEIFSIDTPRVIIDHDILLTNIHMIQSYAEKNNVHLRPHVKAHKCLNVANIQLEEGAIGFTASKVDEASVFFNTKMKSITIAYPLVEKNKIQRIISTSRQFGVELNLVVDSEEGYNLISYMCEKMNFKINMYLKIDVGLNRCGLPPDDLRVSKIAKKNIENKYIEFKGLLSHAGHVYKTKDIQEVEKIALNEIKILIKTRELLLDYDIEIKEISIGSTPTLLAGISLEGISEIRPGNFVFMDRLPWKLGLITTEQISLTVTATIISKNKNYFILDAGSKVLSSDTGAHGSKLLEGYGIAYPAEKFLEENKKMRIVALSEEHGFIKRPKFDLPIGSKIRIIPNHACAVVNLTDSLIIHKNNVITDVWKVHARGKVL